MKLVKIIDGKPAPYTESDFRAANKHTVFGPVVAARDLNAQGVYRVRTLRKPDEPIGKKAVQETLPAQNEYAEWVLGWKLVPLDESEARALRNRLLSETDWMALSDNTMTQAWADYRQALRDIPQQLGFPYSVVWPTKPE